MKNPSFDLNVRYLDFDGRKIEINYVSSLCSDELIAYLVEGKLLSKKFSISSLK